MLKRVLVVVLAKRVAQPRPSKSTKMASPSSTLAHASNASLASTIAPPAPSPKANNSGFIETLNPSAAPQDVALFLFAAYVLVSLRAYGVGSGYVLVSLRAYARLCASRLLAQIVLLEMHEISSTMRKSRFSVIFFSFVV